MYYEDRLYADISTPSPFVKPARSGTNDVSRFPVPSSASNPPMHFLSKPILAPSLYDDPAFSPDPHSHPFFATSHWAPSQPQHPRPPSNHESRRPHRIDTARTRPDEPQLLSPKTPMFSDDHSSTTHETSSSSNHTSTSSASQSTAPTSHDSHSSGPNEPPEPPQPTPAPPEKKKNTISMFWRRSLSDTASKPADLTPPAPDPPFHSKTPLSARPITTRNRTTPDVKPTDRPFLPPRGATTAADSKPPPAASRRIIGGQTMQVTELDRIDELDESNPLGLPLHHRGPYEALHKAVDQEAPENDPSPNVDSQNEYSAPYGSAKERIKPPKQSRKKHRPVDPNQVISVPYVPIGVSLNLQPGQILPHTNPYHTFFQLGQVLGRTSQPNTPTQHPSQNEVYPLQQPSYPPLEQPRWPSELGPSVGDHQDPRHDGSHRSSRRRSMPVDFQGAQTDEKAGRRDRRSPSASHILSAFPDVSGEVYQEFNPYLLYDDQRTPRQSVIDPQVHTNGQYIPSPNPPLPPPDRSTSSTPRPSQANTHLPPRMQALQRNKASQNTRAVDEPPRHSHHRSHTANAAFAVENAPVQAHLSERRRAHIPLPPNYTTVVEMEQPPRFQDNYGLSAPAVQNAFEMAPNTVSVQLQEVQRVVSPQPPPQPRVEQDAWKSQQSITSSAKSSQSAGSRGPPLPHHIPKRLIMPTPLQPSHLTTPRRQPRQPDVLEWPPQLRPTSPDLVLPPSLTTHTNVELYRAQDIAMSQAQAQAQGRKLRKRSSAPGIPGPGNNNNYPSPQSPLSFEPTVGYLDILPPQVSQPPSRPKVEKVPKNVLSKRRTDF